MTDSKNIRIYCFYNKDTFVPVQDELYIPVMAGNVVTQINLNVINSSSRKKNWEGYYSEETRNIVSDIYHEDLKYFEYEK